METTHDTGHKSSPTDPDDSTNAESDTQATIDGSPFTCRDDDCSAVLHAWRAPQPRRTRPQPGWRVMAAENVVWIEDVRERVETELRAESFPKRVAENILQPVEAGSFDPDERAGDTTTEADDGDVLELGSKLTKEGDFFEVAGLSLTDSLPETTTTQTYQASTLADWATALADVEAVVHVGVAPTRHSDSGETSLALYAQIGDSDVVAFAAPLLPTEDGDESEDEGVDAEEIIQDLQGARTTTEGGECGCGVCRDDGGDA